MDQPAFTINKEPDLLESFQREDGELKDEEKEDNLDWSFYDNLGLPEPYRLPKRTSGPPEPLQTIYDYPYRFTKKRAIGKLEGAESVDSLVENDKKLSSKINSTIFKEKLQELRLAKIANLIENSPYEPNPERMYQYFENNEKLVYKIRNNDPQTFNQVSFSLQNQHRNKKPQTVSSIENVGNESYEYYYQPKDKNDATLVFESRFESGNLAMATKVSENEYNLLLQNDINTLGYGQWFFFQVTNTKQNHKVKFNILNYVKSLTNFFNEKRKNDSLHNYGMKILAFSVKDSQEQNIGWVRDGTNIKYNCNTITRQHIPNKFYRTLSWEYKFKYDDDKVFFAYALPYTYTDLVTYLDQIENDETKSRYFRRSTLCKTEAGNKCETITITHHKRPDDCERKQCIVLTARVHPGETSSSYVIQGVIDFLLSDLKEAQILRENFIFKIIPMLNPDGVIHGNSRCSLAGCDLNRRWKNPSNTFHPTIYYAKKLIEKLHSKYKLAFYCDFHGHSKKKDIFIYGCQSVMQSVQVRMFPWILSQTSSLFNYRKCTFHINSSKIGTARAFVFQDLKVINSCTLETSFFGSEQASSHFTTEDLFKFGSDFCKALLLYFSEDLNLCKLQRLLDSQEDLEKNLATKKEEILQKFFASKENLEVGDVSSDSGSDSDASDDNLPYEPKKTNFKSVTPKKTKKILQVKESVRRIRKYSPEQKVSLDLDKCLEPKKAQEEQKSGQAKNTRGCKLSSCGNENVKQNSNILTPQMTKYGKVSIVALGGPYINYTDLTNDREPIEKSQPDTKAQRLEHSGSRGKNITTEIFRRLALIPSPERPFQKNQHGRNISVETNLGTNTQAPSPRLPQPSFFPNKAVIEETLNQKILSQKPVLKSRKEIYHIGFNKLRNNPQNEEFNRYIFPNNVAKRIPRNKLIDITMFRERIDVSRINKSPPTNNTMFLDQEQKYKQTDASFQKAPKYRLDFSKVSKTDLNQVDEPCISDSNRTGANKVAKATRSTAPQIVAKHDQYYVATSLPVLQSLLGKMIRKVDAAKVKETNTTEVSFSMKEESRPKNKPVHPRSKSTSRKELANLPKLAQNSFRE